MKARLIIQAARDHGLTMQRLLPVFATLDQKQLCGALQSRAERFFVIAGFRGAIAKTREQTADAVLPLSRVRAGVSEMLDRFADRTTD